MNVNVTFRNLETTQAIRDYAETKLEKVRKVLVKPLEANVVLSVERFQHIAEVSIRAKEATFNGTEKNEDMYAAIDLVMDKVERQARRFKERTKQKKGRSSHREVLAREEVEEQY